MESFDTLRNSLTNGLKHTYSPTHPPEVYQLSRQREACQLQKDYRTAAGLETQLNELKLQHEDQLLQELEGQQVKELAASDASFQQACGQLMQTWDERIQDVGQQLQDAEHQMLARQEDETASLLAAQAAVQPRPKFSPALLNMRHIERSLAYQKEFLKADKVKQQADQLELLELSQMGTEVAGKMEAQQSRLASRHSKEWEAAAKKASSALLAAHQRREHEIEQLTRRYQAVKLSLSRTHAAQRLALQQNLRGMLGLSRPSKLLGLPSFGSSLAETRGLVPDPRPTKGFAMPAALLLPAAGQAGGGSGALSPTRCKSPVFDLPSTSFDTSPGRLVASQDSAAGTGGSFGARRQGTATVAARAAAAAAAAGQGLARVAMPALAASGSSSKVRRSSKNDINDVIRPYTSSSSNRGWALPAGARGGAQQAAGSAPGNGLGNQGVQHGSAAAAISGTGHLPAAAGASRAGTPASTLCSSFGKAHGSLRGSWGFSSSSSSKGGNGSPSSAVDFGSDARPFTSHSIVKPAMTVARCDSSNISANSSSSSLSPWRGAATTPQAAPRSRLQSVQGASAGGNVPAQQQAVQAQEQQHVEVHCVQHAEIGEPGVALVRPEGAAGGVLAAGAEQQAAAQETAAAAVAAAVQSSSGALYGAASLPSERSLVEDSGSERVWGGAAAAADEEGGLGASGKEEAVQRGTWDGVADCMADTVVAGGEASGGLGGERSPVHEVADDAPVQAPGLWAEENDAGLEAAASEGAFE